MGRRKIQIAPIADDRNRSVTFLKRKNGLMKKAYELGILCGADVAVIVFSGNGKLYEFSSGDLNSTLLRYSKHDGPPHEHRGPGDYDGSKAKGGPAPRTSNPAPVTEGDDEEGGDEEGADEVSDAAAAPSSDEKGKGRAWPPAQSTSTTAPPHPPPPPPPHPHPHPQQQQPYPFDPSTMFPYGFNGPIPGHPHAAAPLYAAAYNAFASRMGGASYPAFAHYPPGFPFAAAPTAPQPSAQTPFLAAAAAAAAAAEAYWGQQRASSAGGAAQMSMPGQSSAPKYDFAALTAAAAGMGGQAIESAKSEPVPSSSSMATGKRPRKNDEDGSTRARSKPRPDPRPASAGPAPTTTTTQEEHTPVSAGGDTTTASAEEQLQALRAFLPGFGDFDLAKADAGQGHEGGQEQGHEAGEFRWPGADG